MRQTKYLLSSPESRAVVLDAIIDVCKFRRWILYALHVRTNHVHGIVDAEAPPARIFNDWKAYSTRALKRAGISAPDRIHWTHGGGSRTIQTHAGLSRAMDYVVHGQSGLLEAYWSDPRLAPPP